MFFQGRGNVYIAEVVEGVLQEAYKRMICPDTFSIDLQTDSFEHINKCGPVDVPDYRGDRSSSGTVNFSFAELGDLNFALAVLGTVTAAGSPGSVVGEDIPGPIAIGDTWFCGGLERHRAITGLTMTVGGSPSGGALTLNTHYTLDAPSGKITFLVAQALGATIGYGYTDPASVSMLSAGTKEYAMMFENINKADANDPGSVELYRVRMSPASNMDFLSDELQIPQLTGTVLADLTKLSSDTEFGQFGRRVL